MPCVQPNVSEYKLTTLTDLFVYAFVTDHDVPYCNLLDRYKAVVGFFFSRSYVDLFVNSLVSVSFTIHTVMLTSILIMLLMQ